VDGLYGSGFTWWVGASSRELLALWQDQVPRLAALSAAQPLPAGAASAAPAG
jgi:hypothetical protein